MVLRAETAGQTDITKECPAISNFLSLNERKGKEKGRERGPSAGNVSGAPGTLSVTLSSHGKPRTQMSKLRLWQTQATEQASGGGWACRLVLCPPHLSRAFQKGRGM